MNNLASILGVGLHLYDVTSRVTTWVSTGWTSLAYSVGWMLSSRYLLILKSKQGAFLAKLGFATQHGMEPERESASPPRRQASAESDEGAQPKRFIGMVDVTVLKLGVSTTARRAGVGLGLSFLAVCLVAPVFAATTLEGLDLVTNQASTRLYLHSEAPISHQTVELTANRLVVELEDVTTAGHIPTDYHAANNIDSVSLRRLDGDKLRLTITGHRLTEPIVGFREAGSRLATQHAKPAQAQPSSPASPAQQVEAPTAKQAITAKSAEANSVNPEAPIEALAAAQPLADAMQQQEKANEISSAATPSEVELAEEMTANLAQSRFDEAATPLNLMTDLDAEAIEPEPQPGPTPTLAIGNQGAEFVKDTVLPWAKNNIDALIQWSVLGLLGIGLAGFIALKWKQLGQQAKQERGEGYNPLARRPVLPPKASPLTTQHISPLGLHGLEQQPHHHQYYQQTQQLPLAPGVSRPKAPANVGSASLQQALGQYSQQTNPGLAGRKRPVGSADNAKKRLAQSLLKDPSSLQEPAQAQPNRPIAPPLGQRAKNRIAQAAAQGEGNPEVLDFLRSVADLMESPQNGPQPQGGNNPLTGPLNR